MIHCSLWDRYPSLGTIITSDKRGALAVKSHHLVMVYAGKEWVSEPVPEKVFVDEDVPVRIFLYQFGLIQVHQK